MEQVSKNQTNNSQENHSHGKVPFISKLAYGMGDVGWNQRSDYRHTHRQDTHQMGTIPSLAALWSTNHGIGAPITALVLILTFWAHNLSGKS